MILRPATVEDAAAIARAHWLAMRVSLPFLPQLHEIQDVVVFIRERVMPANHVWVAEVDDGVVGYVAFHPGWIEHLYVHPDHQGRGLGPALLDKALEDGTERQLWTFQQNSRARAFYEKRGFVAVELTDGAGNGEKTPDVRYVRAAQSTSGL